MMDVIEAVMQPQFIVTTAAAVAAFATVLTLITPLLSRDRMSQRMKVMALERDKLRAARIADLKMGGESPTRLRQAPKGFMQELVDRLNLRSVFETEELKAKLKMAGLRGQAPLVTYMFFRVVMPIILTIVALFYMFVVLTNLTYPPIVKIAIALGVGFGGFYLPNLMLENLIQRRQASLKEAFPDALDMLLICVQAGMSIEAAFGKIAKEIANQSVELAEEFSLTTAELSYLSDRRQAYENLGKRTGIAGIKAVATALIQAERYGTPVGQALRVMAKENRDMRMSEAEKKAAALPPKLTVPMIVFFLPVLFIVILGPAIIQVMKLG
ncbi:MAG: type II secretion system protein [Proteobacteria bacterium]|jgi:Flp pilus assembly protein TadC|nr:MAG: type II secretion system protein [Pseudomonadota bacterium]